jgi:hypothetical protein
MERKLLRQRLRLAYGLSVLEARSIPLNEAAAMLVKCKKLRLPYNHSEVVKGYRIYYNITKTVRLKGRDYHTLLMGNPTKKDLVKYATLVKGVQLRKDMKKAQMKAVILKALGASGVTEPTAIRAVRARIMRKGGKPVKPSVGETIANTVRVYVTKTVPKRNNNVKAPNNNSLVMPKPIPKPGEEVKPMNVSLPNAPPPAPPSALKPVNVNPFNSKPVNNGRMKFMGMPMPTFTPAPAPAPAPGAGPVVTVTGGGRNNNRGRGGLLGGMGNLKIAKNLFGTGNNPAAIRQMELNHQIKIENLKNRRNAAKNQKQKNNLNLQIKKQNATFEMQRKAVDQKKLLKVNQIETLNAVVNNMRTFVGPSALKRAKNGNTGFNNKNTNSDREYIKQMVEMMTKKKKLFSRRQGYSDTTRKQALNLIERYRKAMRGKGVVNARNVNTKLANHKKKHNNNSDYRTTTFLRLEAKIRNSNNNLNVLSEALKATESGNLMPFEYKELQLQQKNVKHNRNKVNNNNMTIRVNNNNNKALINSLPQNARAKREASTQRRMNMLQSINNLKKITNSVQLNAAKKDLESKVNDGKFAKATKRKMRIAIGKIKLNNSTPALTPSPAPPERVTAIDKGKSPEVISENGNNGASVNKNQDSISRMLNALESSVNQMSPGDFGHKYKLISNSLKNTPFTDLKTRLLSVGQKRQGHNNTFNPTAFNNNGFVASRTRGV